MIDDGSKDDTYAIMQEYARTHPLFEPLPKPNGGHGATVLYGYHYALEHGADYIFQTDSDGQTLPEEFEPFWKQKESYGLWVDAKKAYQEGRCAKRSSSQRSRCSRTTVDFRNDWSM